MYFCSIPNRSYTLLCPAYPSLNTVQALQLLRIALFSHSYHDNHGPRNELNLIVYGKTKPSDSFDG